MLQSDAELDRIRESMRAILGSWGIEVRVTPWLVQLTDGHQRVRYSNRIKGRSRNIGRLRRLGALSRAVTAGELRGVHLWESLQAIAVMDDLYPVWLRTASGSIAAAAIAMLTVGSANLFLAVVLAATVVQATTHLSQRLPRWLENLTAGGVAMIAGLCLSHLIPGLDPRAIAAGGLVPLVPGILSEAIMADLLAADLISAALRAEETIKSAAALAAGVQLILWAERLVGKG